MTRAVAHPVAPALAAPEAARGAGVYLHIPFCLRRCDYCDFNTYADRDALIPAYVAALRADIAAVAAAGPSAVGPAHVAVDREWPAFGSVFVGGGTPTLLPVDDLAAIVGDVTSRLPMADDCEITVEANPETVHAGQMQMLAAAGVTRVSIGAQSFATHVLAALGRWHDRDAPLRAVEACRAAGVPRVSLDLIYGTPAETDDDWRETVATALATGVGHLSAYALTVEHNTGYARRIASGDAQPPDDDVQADRMEQVDALAAAAGLRRYELSNWARPGQESRHNRVYWCGGDWLGIGAGAHGHWQGRRWWSARTPERYIADLGRGGSPVAGSEVPDAAQRRAERLMMGLRLVEGVRRDDVDPVDDLAVAQLVAAGLLLDDGTRLALTSTGMRLATDVTLRLL